MENLRVRTSYKQVGVSMLAMLSLLILAGSSVANAAFPYVRTYGNDVVAGGGYRTALGCNPNGAVDEAVEAYGDFTGAPFHQNYRGSGSELAVFAPGPIQGFLPGSTAPPRANSALFEMSYANDVGAYRSPGSLGFGGGFTGESCVDPFPDPASEPGEWIIWNGGTVNVPDPAGGPDIILQDYMDISLLPSGKYWIQSPTFHIGADNVSSAAPIQYIPDGRRVTIVVDTDDAAMSGNLTINSNIEYAGVSGGWFSVGDIPLLQVYVRDNLRIDHRIDEITGLFHSGKDSGDGNIWTCTEGSQEFTTNPADAPFGPDAIATQCNKRLIVYGALVGNRTYFYRTAGDVATALPGPIGPNGYKTTAIGEVIVFSPDIYLALLDEQDPVFSFDEIDSIKSLPPAL